MTFLLSIAKSSQLLTVTDIPKIKGIPEIPGALPITGHLLELGEDHATVCEVCLCIRRTFNDDLMA